VLLCWAAVAAAAEEYASQTCTATAAFDYFQRGAEAQVEARIDNPHCAASSGSFIVEITIKADNADAAEKLRFEEAWDRSDDQTIVFARRYPIGDDVDLLRIRIRKLSCDCATE
jgi:hypothetical protein